MATTPTASATELRTRFDKARGEGRWQHALELAKQLAKIFPDAEHHELLRVATFERGKQLLRDGKPRDAIVVLKNALVMNGPPEFQAAIAAKLAEAGDLSSAFPLLAQATAGGGASEHLIKAVDATVVRGAQGRVNLPVEFHAGFDAVVAAFEAVAQGRDDDARQSLQSISVTSPFLEWKLLIRGLSAYYQNDDVRALDNWQRLNRERMPWRLAAPLRFAIDPAFREAQPTATRQRFQQFHDRSVGGEIVPALRALELGPWESEKKSLAAIERAVMLDKALGHSPVIAEKVRRAVYSAVAQHGGFRTVEAFKKRMPPPVLDPHCNRLLALMGELIHDPVAAVEGWLEYVKEVPALGERLGDTKLAEALVWEKLAAAIGAAMVEFKNLPTYIPGMEDCLRRSIALIPDRLSPHKILLALLIGQPKHEKAALAAARDLVARFPDHAPTWLYLGDRFVKGRKVADAVDAYRAAVKADPMNPEPRRKLANLLWTQAIALTTKKTKAGPNPEKYRPLLDESTRLTEEGRISRLAMWAMLETRLGHAEAAQEILDRAARLPEAANILPLALHLAASIDKKLPAEIRERYQSQWKAVRGASKAPGDVVAALEMIVPFDSKGLRGKRELVKSLLPKTTGRAIERFSADQVIRIARALLELKMRPQARDVACDGQARFPKNPWLPLLVVEIRGEQAPRWQLGDWIERARKLATSLPQAEQVRILDKADELAERFNVLDDGPGFGLLDAIFGSPNDDFDEDDEDVDGGFF